MKMQTQIFFSIQMKHIDIIFIECNKEVKKKDKIIKREEAKIMKHEFSAYKIDSFSLLSSSPLPFLYIYEERKQRHSSLPLDL